MFYWISPSNHNLCLSFSMQSSMFMSTTGVYLGIIWAKKANGNTFSDVPIIKTKSAYFMISGAVKNYFGKAYPKKVISGLINPSQSHKRACYNLIASIHFSIGDYFLHLIQWELLECPWAWIIKSGLRPAFTYKSSIFWVKTFNKVFSS